MFHIKESMTSTISTLEQTLKSYWWPWSCGTTIGHHFDNGFVVRLDAIMKRLTNYVQFNWNIKWLVWSRCLKTGNGAISLIRSIMILARLTSNIFIRKSQWLLVVYHGFLRHYGPKPSVSNTSHHCLIWVVVKWLSITIGNLLSLKWFPTLVMPCDITMA